MLKFEIVSSRTVDVASEKKYVAYMLQVRQDVTAIDREPANVERRYTHFLDLYTGLKKESPAILNNVSFPRKIIVGNFDPNLISTRCNAFEDLLKIVAADLRLRESAASIAFLQNPELNEAKYLIEGGLYDDAYNILETSFRLLNKVYTDRSHVVLTALCRTVACAASSIKVERGERWANLALRRYEAVSDSDLLMLYVPLLHTCISIWEKLGKDKSHLVEELNDLRKRGMKVDSALTLMEAVGSFSATV